MPNDSLCIDPRSARTHSPVPTPAGKSVRKVATGKTSMFCRDPQTLAALTRQALARRIRTASTSDPLRVWVPQCAAGEEAYTIAICLLERFRTLRMTPHLQIFATDPDDEALTLTRAGVYPRSALLGVSPEGFSSYFEPVGEVLVRVHSRVRTLLSISPHDALHDPPIFSRLDLISARNLPAHPPAEMLARLATDAQFALRADGWLLLGAEAHEAALLERFVSLADPLPLYRKRLQPPARSTPLRPPINSVPQTPVATFDPPQSRAQALMQGQAQTQTQARTSSEEPAVRHAELHHKLRALEDRNDDLTRLIDMLDVAAIFLAADLRIRSFTDAAERLLGVGAIDLGRPLGLLPTPRIDASLLEDVRRTVTTGITGHREIHCENHRWYLRRVQPHASADSPDGVLITWADITSLKTLQGEVSRIAALEQQRIGQELHDGLQQELTALALFAQNLRDALESAGTPQQQRQWAGKLTEGIGALSRQAQALAQGLVPVPVEADGLAPALAALARNTSEYTEATCEFTLQGEVHLPSAEVATHVYRLAQEAVRNAVRHARASRITISLDARDGDVRLEIGDNGIGIPPQTGFGRGLGLRLMAHRCALIGGIFSARGEPGGGSRIACTLPGADAPA